MPLHPALAINVYINPNLLKDNARIACGFDRYHRGGGKQPETRYEPEAPIGCEPGRSTARGMWRRQARLRGMHDEYAEPEVTRKYGELQMEPWVYQMWGGMLGMRS